MSQRRALFLDKDGVISVNHGYVCTPERTDFIGGIFDAVRTANAHEWLVAVVTNQAGIARGYYTEAQFRAYMDWVREQFQQHGAHIDAVYYCPHHPVHGQGQYLRDCDCRKPKPGMLLAAQRDWQIDMRQSLMLGDADSDRQAGAAAGVGTCLTACTMPGRAAGETVMTADFLRKLLGLLAAVPAAPMQGEERS